LEQGEGVMEQKRVIMNAVEIDLALKRIALQILEKNGGTEDLAIVGIHTCGVYLAQRIHRILEKQTGDSIMYGSLDITLYRDDWSLISQNPVVKTTDIQFDVDNCHVVLVDDVVYTGRTIRAAMDALVDYGRPTSIQLAVLVDRGGREIPIQPDCAGLVTQVLPKEKIQVCMTEENKTDEVVIIS